MKIYKLIKSGILPEGSIVLNGCKKPVEKIVSEILGYKLLYLDGENKYIRLSTHYQKITDDDLRMLVRELIAPADRNGVPTRVIRDAIDILAETMELQVDLEALAQNSWHLINLKNGVYDINSQKLLPHDINYGFDYCLNFNYITPDKRQLTTYGYYLNSSVGAENAESIRILIGYALSSITDVKKAVIIVGAPHSGKSKILDVIERAVGTEYVRTNPFHKIGSEQAVASYLGGARVNLSRDVKIGAIREDEGFKSVISCEPINGRLLYQNSRTVTPRVRCIAASNSVPHFKNPDDASLDRLILIKIKGYKGKIDHQLPQQLYSEVDSICSEAIDTLKGFVQSNYDFMLSEESLELLKHEKAKLHTVESFLDENYQKDANGRVSSVVLYEQYCSWCRQNGFDPIGKNTFYDTVRNDGSIVYRKVPAGNSYVNGFWGISRKNQDSTAIHDEMDCTYNCPDNMQEVV